MLNITTLDIPSSHNCNENYLEVFIKNKFFLALLFMNQFWWKFLLSWRCKSEVIEGHIRSLFCLIERFRKVLLYYNLDLRSYGQLLSLFCFYLFYFNRNEIFVWKAFTFINRRGRFLTAYFFLSSMCAKREGASSYIEFVTEIMKFLKTILAWY